VPAVQADPVLLERALANLIANAIVWSPPTEPVRVSAVAVGSKVVLRIADRGPGIAPAERERVFEPFQRRGDRSSQAGVGLGLDDTPGGGLSVVISLGIAPDDTDGRAVTDEPR
jgi:two-component system sensor histidine kinase KdpD